MVLPNQPGSLEPAVLPRKVHIKKADVGIVSGDGCDAGDGIRSHGEHLMTARLQSGGQCLSQNLMVITEHQPQ
jgi:hypothetical protein